VKEREGTERSRRGQGDGGQEDGQRGAKEGEDHRTHCMSCLPNEEGRARADTDEYENKRRRGRAQRGGRDQKRTRRGRARRR